MSMFTSHYINNWNQKIYSALTAEARSRGFVSPQFSEMSLLRAIVLLGFIGSGIAVIDNSK